MSEETEMTKDKTAPKKPTGLKLTKAKKETRIHWGSSGDDVKGYEIEVRGEKLVQLSFVTDPSFTSSKIEDGAKVRVRAVNAEEHVSDWADLDG